MRAASLLLLLLSLLGHAQVRAATPPVVHLTAAHPVTPLRPYLTVFAVPRGQAVPPWSAVRMGTLDALFQPPAVVGPTRPYHAACWVHARLRPTPTARSTAPLTWDLETSGGGLDQDFDIYLVEPDGQWQHFALRSDAPGAGRDVPTRHYSLRLPLKPGITTDFYLYTARGGSLAFTIYERQALVRHATRADLFDGLYLGLLLGLVLYNLLLFFAIGDRGYLYYVAFTAFFGLVQIDSIGWWGVVFGGGLGLRAPAFLIYALLTLVMVSALLAARAFLELPQRRPGLDRWLRWALPLPFLPLAAIWMPGPMEAFAVPIVQLIVSLLILGATVSQFRAGYRPARYLLVGWGLLLVAIILYSLRGLGLMPWNWLTIYGVRVASGLESILFSLGLADRINLARRERHEAQSAALAALQEKEIAQAAANAALLSRADELQRAYAELQASLATTNRLQSLDEAKTRFFTNVSHELRTPLTLILSPLDELRHGRLPPAPATFDLLHRQATRLLALINQLLDVARLEAGQLRLHRQPIEFGAWVRLRVGTFASAAAGQGLQLTLSLPPRPVRVEIDPDQFEKVIDNLLGNALKFTPEGGRITVELTTDAATGHVALSVTDTGPGVAAAHLPFLFDRFYQADDSARRPYGGSGIGLALVKELAELHQGTVAVASPEGSGTRFTVTLPVLRTAAPETAAPPLAPAPPAAEQLPVFVAPPVSADSDLPLIVILDDQDDMRTYLAACLSPEYRVLTEANGEAGLTLLADTIPDLVITDLMMPHLDGLAFCRQLRADERTSHIPLILLTARTDDASRLEAFALGADDYLTKPFAAPELRARVANLLAQRRQLRERFRRELFLQPAGITIPPADEVFLTRVLAVAEAHLADADFDVEAFARALALSRIQLYRKLKALTDQSPTDFLRAFRLQRAADLLAGSTGTVADVAYAVGFNSLSYFGKCFRERFGYPPSEHPRRKSI